MKNIGAVSLLVVLVAIVAVVLVVPDLAWAADLNYKVDTSTLPTPDSKASKVQDFLAVIFAILGALSLLMLTIGGLRYVLSDGDPQAASRAKATILYSIIGLVVAVCAVAIVTFVLGRV